ncbi:MAG: holo-ACP synthase [Candidatus Omnitrophica bacterium]|nr:holo-ACP synthase [Candidatus Omnitrophota bacterium]
MKIVGTGVDLVEVPRFHQAVQRWGAVFLNRIFTPSELEYARGRKTAAQHLAVRFAAKEAVVKALGAPKGLGLEWHDLEISRTPAGQPKVVFHRSMRRWVGLEVHLSMTHTAEHAIATALVVAPGKSE